MNLKDDPEWNGFIRAYRRQENVDFVFNLLKLVLIAVILLVLFLGSCANAQSADLIGDVAGVGTDTLPPEIIPTPDISTIYHRQPANGIHADSVEFVSTSDLIAQVNEIVAVCDTVTEIIEWADSVICCDTIQYLDEEYYFFYLHYFKGDTIYSQNSYEKLYTRLIITCRKLVTVAVVKPLVFYDAWPAGGRKVPGRAVVWFEKVKTK